MAIIFTIIVMAFYCLKLWYNFIIMSKNKKKQQTINDFLSYHNSAGLELTDKNTKSYFATLKLNYPPRVYEGKIKAISEFLEKQNSEHHKDSVPLEDDDMSLFGDSDLPLKDNSILSKGFDDFDKGQELFKCRALICEWLDKKKGSYLFICRKALKDYDDYSRKIKVSFLYMQEVDGLKFKDFLDKKYKPATVMAKVLIVKSLYNYFIANGYKDLENPFRSISKDNKKPRVNISNEDFVRSFGFVPK